MHVISLLFLLTSLLLVASSFRSCDINGDVNNPAPLPDEVSPDVYEVTFHTNLLINSIPAAPIRIKVMRTWAPLGSDRFYSLVKDGFYNGAAFFRVVPDFGVQYGISAVPKESTKWNTTILDDPVIVSNIPWTISFATAGPNTRTSQIFINYIDNSRLDDMGFAPFAEVIDGFDTALNLFNPTPGDSNGVDQDMYYAYGNPWIVSSYPDISLITCTELV
jgi:peptidyl-prolyl cis-trans isomerase A (cyclophilin A)